MALWKNKEKTIVLSFEKTSYNCNGIEIKIEDSSSFGNIIMFIHEKITVFFNFLLVAERKCKNETCVNDVFEAHC